MSQDPVQEMLAKAIPEWAGLCDEEPMRLGGVLATYVYQFTADVVRSVAEDLDANTAHRCDNGDLIRDFAELLEHRARLVSLFSAQ